MPARPNRPEPIPWVMLLSTAQPIGSSAQCPAGTSSNASEPLEAVCPPGGPGRSQDKQDRSQHQRGTAKRATATLHLNHLSEGTDEPSVRLGYVRPCMCFV